MDISVIITCSANQRRDDAQSLYYSYKRLIEETNMESEFIYVTDDSTDDFLGQLKELQKKEEDIKIIKTARWFGDASALNIGFEEASGNLILTLPAYQQVNNKEISLIINSFNDADLVIARRVRKKDNIFFRIQAKVFHSLVQLFIGMHYKDLGCGVRLFNRDVLEHIYIYGDQIRFLPLLANKYGFKVKEVEVEQSVALHSHGVYSPGHYAERLVDLISIFFLIKFTKKPLRFFGFPGFIIFSAGTLLAFYLFYERMFLSIGLADRPIVLISILLIVFGIQLFAIGIVAEIIIFTHSKDSKEYIVEEIIETKNLSQINTENKSIDKKVKSEYFKH